MAEGALAHSHADLTVAITASPGPPAALRKSRWARFVLPGRHANSRPESHPALSGDREAVRRQAIKAALEGLSALLSGLPQKG